MQLVAVLREVKYLEIREKEEIPGSAATMYSKNDTFRKFVANLDLTVQWYNKVRKTVLEVEYPLVEGQLEEIDVQLKQAEDSLNWENEGMLAPFPACRFVFFAECGERERERERQTYRQTDR